MYETKSQALLPRARFAKHLLLHVSVALGVLLASLGAGMTG